MVCPYWEVSVIFKVVIYSFTLYASLLIVVVRHSKRFILIISIAEYEVLEMVKRPSFEESQFSASSNDSEEREGSEVESEEESEEETEVGKDSSVVNIFK